MLSTHNIFGSRPPTSRKRKSLCARFTLVVNTAFLSPAYSLSNPPCRVRRLILGPDATVCCTTYSKRACLVWDKRKGSPWLPGCQSQGRCSRGRICRAPRNGGPAGGAGARAKALGFRWFVPKGGNHNCPVYWAVPVGTGSRAQARDCSRALLPCLLVCSEQMHATDHLFWCRWTLLVAWLLIPHSPTPFPPVDRCGHTRVPPKIPRLLVGQISTGSEVQLRISHAQASRRVLTGAPKRFDM